MVLVIVTWSIIQAGYDDFNVYCWDAVCDGKSASPLWVLAGHDNRVTHGVMDRHAARGAGSVSDQWMNCRSHVLVSVQLVSACVPGPGIIS